MARAGVEIVPSLRMGGQVDAAFGRALLQHRGDEKVGADHEAVVDRNRAGISAEMVEQRRHHRLVRGRGAPHLRVVIGHQAPPEQHQVADAVGDLGVHPRLVDDVVRLPAVHHEARPEAAELDEAAEQLRVRRRPVEAADVVAGVEHPRQAHVEPLGEVVAQRLPFGLVVARPGLAVAPGARIARAGDHIGALARRVRGLCLVRDLEHQHRLRRPREDLRERAAIAVAGRVLVPDLVFVVVRPDRGHAVIEQRGGDAVVPPAAPLRMGEVDMVAEPVPELRHSGFARLAVADQEAARLRLVQARVVVEQAGLEVGDRHHARLAQRLERPLRIGELLPVPVEGVAAAVDRRVARPEVEALDRHGVRLGLVDEGGDAAARVGGVEDRHRGEAEAQRPARRERLPAGQPREAAHHVGHARPGEHPIIEVAVARAVGAEVAVIIVDRRAQIDVRHREIVVEDAVRAGVAVDDHHRHHLVERIAELGIVAARVDRIDLEAASGPVERPGLVAEAVMPLSGIARHEVPEVAALARREIGLGGPVLEEGTVLAGPVPCDAEGIEADARGQAAGHGEGDAVRHLLDPHVRQGEARQVVARSPLIGRLQPARGDRPAAIEAIAFGAPQHDAADIGLHHRDAQFVAVLEVEDRPSVFLAAIRSPGQRLHPAFLPVSAAECRSFAIW